MISTSLQDPKKNLDPLCIYILRQIDLPTHTNINFHAYGMEISIETSKDMVTG